MENSHLVLTALGAIVVTGVALLRKFNVVSAGERVGKKNLAFFFALLAIAIVMATNLLR